MQSKYKTSNWLFQLSEWLVWTVYVITTIHICNVDVQCTRCLDWTHHETWKKKKSISEHIYVFIQFFFSKFIRNFSQYIQVKITEYFEKSPCSIWSTKFAPTCLDAFYSATRAGWMLVTKTLFQRRLESQEQRAQFSRARKVVWMWFCS